MGRKQTNTYDSTPFSRRICQLQEEHGYTDQEVIEGVIDENGNPLITGEQAYKTHKTGRSQPNNIQDMLRGYARFYGVSIDYLLEMTDDQTPEVGTVNEITGLSAAAVRQLTTLKDESPVLLEMVDAILSAAAAENIASLYARIYKDYKEAKANIPDMFPEMSEAQQTRFAKELYKRIQSVVVGRLSPLFDREIMNEEDMRMVSIEDTSADTVSDGNMIADLIEDTPK